VGNPISKADTYTLQLASSLESLNQLESFIEDIRIKYSIQEEVYANVLICLNEACINAIVHGNQLSPTLKVYINLEVWDKKRLVFNISDEGKGFDYQTLEDPTLVENREKEVGRGVYIIRKLADQCIFNDQGNQLELHFKI
jgi:serine/threonine-protein kinase RsbW